MEHLHIEGTQSSPVIDFDCDNHLMEIRGETYPENAADFYAPVLAWIEEYLASTVDDPTTVNLEIIYANSSSTKILMDIFDMLDDAASEGKSITVNWFYDPDNESALELGEDFEEEVEAIIFNLIELES